MSEWRARCEWKGCQEEATRHLTLSADMRDKVTMLVCEAHYEVGMDHLRAGATLQQGTHVQLLVQQRIKYL
jgi:hypothetical protein